MDVIDRNEKMNEAGPDKIIESSNASSNNNLLSFDNKFYNVQKKLMWYQDYPQIAKKLHT